jgi:H+/gluconate symporter-like permease|nr:hypothetical protein [uncultured Oscillibacter sp.]
MSMALGVIGIILALLALMYLAYRDWSPLYLGFVVTLIVILTNGMPLTETITDVYLPGVASFAGPFFGMMLFGAIIGKIYDVSGAATSIARGLIGTFSPADSGRSDNFKTAIVVLIACLTGALLTYGGINNIVLMITMFPITLSLCAETNIPRRWAIGMAVSGSSTFVVGGVFSPNATNVAAMNLMGTSSGAALIPGIIGAIVEIIVMMVVFTVLVARSRARGEVFAYGPKDTVHEGEERLPNPWLAAIPLVFTFVVFNFFKVNITVVLAVTTVLSAVLFYPQLKKHGIIKTINDGALSATSSLLMISAIVGFGSVVNSAESFQFLVDKLLSISIHPYFLLIICVLVFAAIAGSSTTAVNLSLTTLGPIFTNMGYPAAAIHRIAAFAATVTDSLPCSGGTMLGCHVANERLRDAYPGIAVSTVLATGCGTLTVALICILFPGLAV